MATTPYSIRLDDATKAALEREAELADRPPAQWAAHAIRTMIAAKQRERAAIDAALTQADTGRFISREVMEAWIDSWGTADELPIPGAHYLTAPLGPGGEARLLARIAQKGGIPADYIRHLVAEDMARGTPEERAAAWRKANADGIAAEASYLDKHGVPGGDIALHSPGPDAEG